MRKILDNKFCVVCGKEFTPKVVQQLCCCKECSKIHQRQHQYRWQKENWKHTEKICKLCGEPFMPACDAPKNYCSQECADAGKRYQHACYMHSVGRRRTMPNIDDYKPGGEKFIQNVFRGNTKHKKHERKTVDKICTICGAKFQTDSPQKYCSPECKRAMSKYQNMLNMWRKGIAKQQPVFADYQKGGRLFSRTRKREGEELRESTEINNCIEQKRIGVLIRQQRKYNKMTQLELGEALGVGMQAVSDYEKGKVKTIPFEKRVKLALTLNIDIIDLLYSTEDDLKLCIARSKKLCQ